MSSRWASLLVAALACPPAAAAQQTRELGVQVIGTASDPGLAIVGAYAAIRPASRFRVSASAGGGVSSGDPAWRGELLAHFLLSPRARRGIGWYAAGGVAVVGGPVDQGYMVLTLGAETGPGSRCGWFVEGGVGGGLRVATGFRQRWPRRSFR